MSEQELFDQQTTEKKMPSMDTDYGPFLYEQTIFNQPGCGGDPDCQARRSYEFLGGLYANSLRHPYGRTAPISELDDWTIKVWKADDRMSVFFEGLPLVERVTARDINLFETTLGVFRSHFQAGNLAAATPYKKALDKLYTHDEVSFELAVHDFGPPADLRFSIWHKGNRLAEQRYSKDGSANSTYFTKRYTIRRFWGEDHLYIPS